MQPPGSNVNGDFEEGYISELLCLIAGIGEDQMMMGRFCFARQQLIPVLMTGSGDRVEMMLVVRITQFGGFTTPCPSSTAIGLLAVDSICLTCVNKGNHQGHH